MRVRYKLRLKLLFFIYPPKMYQNRRLNRRFAPPLKGVNTGFEAVFLQHLVFAIANQLPHLGFIPMRQLFYLIYSILMLFSFAKLSAFEPALTRRTRSLSFVPSDCIKALLSITLTDSGIVTVFTPDFVIITEPI